MNRLSVLLACVFLQGCGGGSDRPPVAPVSGVVTMGGKPVANANITFHLDGAPRSGMGRTDESGTFSITTYDHDDGAFLGTHTVTVSKVEESTAVGGEDMEIGGDAYSKAMAAAANPGAALAKEELPAKYAKKETSPLKVKVDEAGQSDVKLIIE
jgi:hypothetical protein